MDTGAPTPGNGTAPLPTPPLPPACPACRPATPAVRRRLDEAHEALDAELQFLLGLTPAIGTPTPATKTAFLTGSMKAFDLVALESAEKLPPTVKLKLKLDANTGDDDEG